VCSTNLPGTRTTSCEGWKAGIWLGFTGPRSPEGRRDGDKPFLRELTLRLPRALWPFAKKYGQSSRSPRTRKSLTIYRTVWRLSETTGVTETPGRLYIRTCIFIRSAG